MRARETWCWVAGLLAGLSRLRLELAGWFRPPSHILPPYPSDPPAWDWWSEIVFEYLRFAPMLLWPVAILVVLALGNPIADGFKRWSMRVVGLAAIVPSVVLAVHALLPSASLEMPIASWFRPGPNVLQVVGALALGLLGHVLFRKGLEVDTYVLSGRPHSCEPCPPRRNQTRDGIA